MPVRDPKDVFLLLLSDAKKNAERSTKLYHGMSELIEDPDAKQALESRAFISGKVLSELDQCFKLLGQQPVQHDGRLQDIFAEDFASELAEIQGPTARRVFILSKALHLTQFRIAEYLALAAAADWNGHFGVGVLLESCLADHLAFVERTRRLLSSVLERRIVDRKLVA